MSEIGQMLRLKNIGSSRHAKGQKVYNEFMYNIPAKEIGHALHSLQNVG